MTGRGLQKGRPRAEAGGSHELIDMSLDYQSENLANISEDSVPGSRY